MSKPAPTFLIVEDYRKMAETIEVCLKRLRPHAGTMTAGSLMKARSLVERHGQPRAIVLDLNLPDSRGLTTLMAVRQMAPDAAVMVFSAIEPESKLQTAIEMGANCALARPRTGYVFVNEIEQWLLEVEETGPLQEHPDLRALGALQREVQVLVEGIDPALAPFAELPRHAAARLPANILQRTPLHLVPLQHRREHLVERAWIIRME